MTFLIKAVLIGAGATLLLDLWAQLLKRVAGFPPPNWAMPGRWVAYLPAGRFVHDDIALASPVRNELAIGWVFHYAVGILFAAALLAIWGLGWAANPTFLPALIVGLVTVGCGWFILQPGMGAGIAASRKPNAGQIRILNIVGHVVFAIGLYGTALLIR
jgi:fatty acid desaturase